MKHRFSIVKAIALFFGVLVIPVLYSFFYLDAFWDPYNSLSKLPVAVVNLDKGATLDGKQRNLGSELVDKLKSSGDLKWEVVSGQNAKEGVEGKKYYASITIPADFSSNIASAESTKKVAASLVYSANEKRNYLASQILNRAIVSLEEQTRSSVNKEITQSLVDKLKDVPSNLTTLQSGLSDLDTGSKSLQSGIGTAAAGQTKVTSGLRSLNSGMSALKSGSASLRSNLYTLDSGLGQAQSGVQTLLLQFKTSGDAAHPTLYDGVTGIKGGLAQLQAQLQAGNGTTAYDQATSGTATYVSSVDSLFYTLIATQIQAAQAQYTATDPANVPADMNTYEQTLVGTYKIVADTAGTAFLPELASKDSNYTALLQNYSGAVNMYDIVNTAVNVANADGSNTAAGITHFTSALAAGTYSYTTANPYLSQVVTQINAANIGASGNTLNSSLKTTLFPTLYAAVSTLYTGSDTLSQQLTAGTNGTTTFYDGVSQLSSALSQLKSGSSALYSGSQQLESGAASAAGATSQLSSGSSQLSSGMNQLSSGASQLSSGLDTAKNGVTDSINTANSQLSSTDGLADYANAPVSVKTQNESSVPNYGTAFAPYFLSLSLWVGALIVLVGIYLDPSKKIKVLTSDSDKRIFRTVIFFLTGSAQAVVLAFAIRYGLGLTVQNLSAYVGACILISFCFMSIVQFLVVFLKDVGKFLAIAFLILQLTSCGGTFPMETVPKIFNVLYPFMPMTYSVGLFKEVISGMETAAASYNALVLLGIFAVFAAATVLCSITRRVRVQAKQSLSQADAD